MLKTQCKEALNLMQVVAHLTWGGHRKTLLMLYRAIVRSKLDYGCIVYGTAQNTKLRQLDSIHNSGLRLVMGAFCTSPVSTEANEAPLEKCCLKLSMHYYLKTRACTSNQAYHVLHEFDGTTRDLYVPRPNGRGNMTGPRTCLIGLKKTVCIGCLLLTLMLWQWLAIFESKEDKLCSSARYMIRIQQTECPLTNWLSYQGSS